MPVVAAGAVPNNVLCTLQAITEFIFLAQNLYHCDETLHSTAEALWEFHHFKTGIILAGGQRRKHGPLLHFQIPKLELAQHVIRSTRAMGAPYQWSSDITERCHITHVKTPYWLSNRHGYHAQCCCFLDWQEKQCFFQLYTTLKMAGAPLINKMTQEVNLMALHYPEFIWISKVLPGEQYLSLLVAAKNSLFNCARSCHIHNFTESTPVLWDISAPPQLWTW